MNNKKFTKDEVFNISNEDNVTVFEFVVALMNALVSKASRAKQVRSNSDDEIYESVRTIMAFVLSIANLGERVTTIQAHNGMEYEISEYQVSDAFKSLIPSSCVRVGSVSYTYKNLGFQFYKYLNLEVPTKTEFSEAQECLFRLKKKANEFAPSAVSYVPAQLSDNLSNLVSPDGVSAIPNGNTPIYVDALVTRDLLYSWVPAREPVDDIVSELAKAIWDKI